VVTKSHMKPVAYNPMIIGGQSIGLGQRKRVQLFVASLYDYTEVSIPIEVVRGEEPGPVLFISAAIHGDEINGVEIIKRVLACSQLKRIKGTLIAVPVVNVFGFNNQSRYLPDRRDLNRCFPGSREGSLAARLAFTFMREVVNKCTHGIDLHTGAIHRSNLPQVRACLDDPITNELALCFGTPVVLHAQLRDGSLREAARRKNIPMLLFEGGEALRFEEPIINVGYKGCLAVMRKIGMLPQSLPKGQKSGEPQPEVKRPVFVAKGSHWIRAPHSGSFSTHKRPGQQVVAGEVLAVISDPFGGNPFEVQAEQTGILIGLSRIPLVNRGDAMFHVATYKDSSTTRKVLASILQIGEGASTLAPY
jgi:predicted deacylase